MNVSVSKEKEVGMGEGGGEREVTCRRCGRKHSEVELSERIAIKCDLISKTSFSRCPGHSKVRGQRFSPHSSGEMAQTGLGFM